MKLQFPTTFELRKGPGNGTIGDGLCFMQVAALIGGERITDRPTCASPVLTEFGVRLNDLMPRSHRQRLRPLAYGMVGTRSRDHEKERFYILIREACRVVRTAAQVERDPQILDVLQMMEDYWSSPKTYREEDQRRIYNIAYVVAQRRFEIGYYYIPHAMKTLAYARPGYADVSLAGCAVEDAARAVACSAVLEEIWDIAIDGLREAIEVGPNSLVELETAQERVFSLAR